MTAKHRLIEITTIIAVTAFIVFMARSCGETIPDVSASIEEPNEAAWTQFEQDCPCGIKMSGPYEGVEYCFVCSNCERVYACAWQGIGYYLNEEGVYSKPYKEIETRLKALVERHE